MSCKWVYSTQNKIYTTIEKRVTDSIGEQYKNLCFTKEEEAGTPSNKFPTVFIKFLNGKEKAKTLKADSISAIECNIQIYVTANKTQGLSTAEKVIWETIDATKKMGFELSSSPVPIATGNDTKSIVARMKRTIASKDNL